MIGVPPDGERQDHDPRGKVPDLLDDDTPGAVGVRETRVRKSCVAAFRHAEDFGRRCRFSRAQLDASARPGLAGGQIENPGSVPLISGLEERAAAGKFDVVPMGRDREKIDHSSGRG